MAIPQPTDPTSTEPTEPTSDVEAMMAVEADDVSTDQDGTDQDSTDNDQANDQDADPTEKLVLVLDAATDETDPITGTVPVMHVSLIVEALRQLRGNAKGETIARWSAQAFTTGLADRGWSANQVGAVLAIVANPPSVAKPAETEPEHVKLARALVVLERARLNLIAGAESVDVADRAEALAGEPTFTLPDGYEARIQAVAREASKGKRGTGPKVDWAEAIVEALNDKGGPMSMAEVKSWAVANLGASQGGAIDRRHAGLLVADDSTGGKDGELWAQGVRARTTEKGVAEFYLV